MEVTLGSQMTYLKEKRKMGRLVEILLSLLSLTCLPQVIASPINTNYCYLLSISRLSKVTTFYFLSLLWVMQASQGRTTTRIAQLGKPRLPAVVRELCTGLIITVNSFPSKGEPPSYQSIKFYKLGNFTTYSFYPQKAVEAKQALQYGGLNLFSLKFSSPSPPSYRKILGPGTISDSRQLANTWCFRASLVAVPALQGINTKTWGSHFFHKQGAPKPAHACC